MIRHLPGGGATAPRVEAGSACSSSDAPSTLAVMTTLSEKAKGKQRVADPAPDTQPGEDVPKTKPLVIRFTEGIEDLNLLVEHRDAVRDVKRKVRYYSA